MAERRSSPSGGGRTDVRRRQAARQSWLAPAQPRAARLREHFVSATSYVRLVQDEEIGRAHTGRDRRARGGRLRGRRLWSLRSVTAPQAASAGAPLSQPAPDAQRTQDLVALTTGQAARQAQRIALVVARGSRVIEGAPGTPFTRTTFAVQHVLKGRLPRRFVLQVIGGRLGDRVVTSPVPAFATSSRYLLFLGPDGPAGPTIFPQAVLDVKRAAAPRSSRRRRAASACSARARRPGARARRGAAPGRRPVLDPPLPAHHGRLTMTRLRLHAGPGRGARRPRRRSRRRLRAPRPADRVPGASAALAHAAHRAHGRQRPDQHPRRDHHRDRHLERRRHGARTRGAPRPWPSTRRPARRLHQGQLRDRVGRPQRRRPARRWSSTRTAASSRLIGLAPASVNGFGLSGGTIHGDQAEINDMYLLINGSRTNFDRRSTEVHELGHTLGLAHSSVGFSIGKDGALSPELESQRADDAPVLDRDQRPPVARGRRRRVALRALPRAELHDHDGHHHRHGDPVRDRRAGARRQRAGDQRRRSDDPAHAPHRLRRQDRRQLHDQRRPARATTTWSSSRWPATTTTSTAWRRSPASTPTSRRSSSTRPRRATARRTPTPTTRRASRSARAGR